MWILIFEIILQANGVRIPFAAYALAIMYTVFGWAWKLALFGKKD